MTAHLFLWGFSGCCALAYGLHFTFQSPSLLRSVVKTSAILLLALISYLSSGPFFLTLALLFGATGDAFLSLRRSQGFLPGLAAFLIGHLCFVLLFIPSAEPLSTLLTQYWRSAIFMVLLILAFFLIAKLRPQLNKLAIPVYCYICIILAMGITALMLPGLPTLRWAIIGSLLFIASDSILSIELFLLESASRLKNLTSPLLWFLYWGGQALIALAFLS